MTRHEGELLLEGSTYDGLCGVGTSVSVSFLKVAQDKTDQ